MDSPSSVGLRIKCPITFLYHLSYIVRLIEEVRQLSIRVKVLDSILLDHVFFAALINFTISSEKFI
jgi:hypothetical protein